MKDSDKLALIAETLEVADRSEVRPELPLADLPEWDSMGMINTIVMLEEHFGVEADYEQLRALTTVGGMMALMERAG